MNKFLILILLIFICNFDVSFAQQYVTRHTLQIDSTTINRADTTTVIKITGNQATDFITIKIDTTFPTGKVPTGYIAVQYADSTGHYYPKYPYVGPDTLMDTLLIGTWQFRPTHVNALFKRFFVKGVSGYGAGRDTLIITISDVQTNK